MREKSRYHPKDNIGGRFLVHQVLMGGMGEVYLCLDLQEKIPIALKTFQSRYLTNRKLRESFKEEVATWIALEKHPNIVDCLTMEVFDNQPFVILEWVANDEGHGTDLRSWLRYKRPLDQRLALNFAVDICNGLIHAGKRQPGIVHRDLKPENILIGQGRIAKITDFGLAKVFQSSNIEVHNLKDESIERHSLESHDGIVGTPTYMAPEQWSGADVNTQTDIYAIGCILYEMFTGEMPFPATKISELKHQHLHSPIPTIKKRVNAPARLDVVLSYCLAKRQSDRFKTVEELLNELSEIYTQNFSGLRIVEKQHKKLAAAEYNGRGVAYLNLSLYEKALG